jgi:hypothetical protein
MPPALPTIDEVQSDMSDSESDDGSYTESVNSQESGDSDASDDTEPGPTDSRGGGMSLFDCKETRVNPSVVWKVVKSGKVFGTSDDAAADDVSLRDLTLVSVATGKAISGKKENTAELWRCLAYRAGNSDAIDYHQVAPDIEKKIISVFASANGKKPAWARWVTASRRRDWTDPKDIVVFGKPGPDSCCLSSALVAVVETELASKGKKRAPQTTAVADPGSANTDKTTPAAKAPVKGQLTKQPASPKKQAAVKPPEVNGARLARTKSVAVPSANSAFVKVATAPDKNVATEPKKKEASSPKRSVTTRVKPAADVASAPAMKRARHTSDIKVTLEFVVRAGDSESIDAFIRQNLGP